MRRVGFDCLESLVLKLKDLSSIRMNSLDDDINGFTDAAEVPRSILFRYVNQEFQNSKLRTNVLP